MRTCVCVCVCVCVHIHEREDGLCEIDGVLRLVHNMTQGVREASWNVLQRR